MNHISRIEVDKLFGLYDHRIELHPEEHITLLHGPNGVGKTALLNMLYGLLNFNYKTFDSIPFKEFRVYFAGDYCVKISKKRIDSQKRIYTNQNAIVQISVFCGSKKLESSKADSDTTFENSINLVLPYFFTKVDDNNWALDISKEVYTTEEAVRYTLTKNSYRLRFPQRIQLELQKFLETQPLSRVLNDSSARLIGVNRLRPRARPSVGRATTAKESEKESTISAVQHHANTIRDIITATLARYSSVSSQRDRTFPERLVHQRTERLDFSDDDLRKRFAGLEYRREQLQVAGLLDSQATARPFTVPDSLDDTTRAVLSVYLDDMEKKLAVFDDLEERLALLKQIVDKRFLNTKKFCIDRNKGFVFYSGKSELELDQLSSGEQHELVVFCELLFNIPDGCFVLIDEPELSLHVAWQLEFLRDVHAITRIRPMEVIIATHSPWIINERWDLTAALSGEPAEKVEEVLSHTSPNSELVVP